MAKRKRDLILHPVRLRLLTELTGRSLTSRQLAAALPDIPQATLYRHIKTLHDGGIFRTVAESMVNGALERTYAVATGQARLTPEELAGMSSDEHKTAFNLFIAALSEQFARYIDQADLNKLIADGLSYNSATIYLSEGERQAFQAEIIAVIGKFTHLGPAADRKRYNLTSIVIPDERSQS